MTYRTALDNERQSKKLLYGVIVGLSVLCLLLFAGWYSSPSRITVHIPPDLRSGAELKVNEIPPSTIYAFAHYIMLQVNYWEKDGGKEYADNIYRLATYLTPRFREVLLADMDERAKKGELFLRTRALNELTGHGYSDSRVTIHGNNAWTVLIDVDINEAVRGMPVKKVAVRYPLRVVRYPVAPDLNPFGLAIDGYAEQGPHRLGDAELTRNSGGEDSKS